MSATLVKEAKGMGEYILARVHRGPGDTIEAALHRAEKLYGAPAQWLHRLRYRDLKDIPASAFFAIYNAYQTASEAAERSYNHEKVLADARNSSLARLAALVAGTENTNRNQQG